MSGTSGEEQEFRIPVLLTPAQYSRLIIDSILNDVSVGELLREAYFVGGSGHDVDD